jgi:prefoldin alpha subunit
VRPAAARRARAERRRADQPILVPLTNSLYVPGKLADAENVLVDIGTGYFVKKVRVRVRAFRRAHSSRPQTRPQAVKYYQAKVELLRKNLEALQDTIAKRQENLNAVTGILQQKVQAQVQATGPGKAS